MNQLFDTDESINSDEAIKSIECKNLTPNFHRNLDYIGTSVHKRMNSINTMMCRFKDSLHSKEVVFTQTSPFNSIKLASCQNGLQQREIPSQNLKPEDFTKQDNVHLAESRKRNNIKICIQEFQEQQLQKNHHNSQVHLDKNIIQARKPRRQIYVTQIVNDHCEITSFPFPKPQKLSRIIQNNDGLSSQRGSSASTPRSILKSSSFEVLRIGSRPSTQSLNSPMMKPNNKQVSFEFTSEQLRKLKINRASLNHNKYQKLKTKIKK